ncbi:hypothetical protein GH733_014789, partial [Mirounga leonina]
MIIKALKELPRDRKEQKNIKHSGNVTSDEKVNIAQQIQLSGTIIEILEIAHSVGCNADGCYPQDIIKTSIVVQWNAQL